MASARSDDDGGDAMVAMLGNGVANGTVSAEEEEEEEELVDGVRAEVTAAVEPSSPVPSLPPAGTELRSNGVIVTEPDPLGIGVRSSGATDTKPEPLLPVMGVRFDGVTETAPDPPLLPPPPEDDDETAGLVSLAATKAVVEEGTAASFLATVSTAGRKVDVAWFGAASDTPVGLDSLVLLVALAIVLLGPQAPLALATTALGSGRGATSGTLLTVDVVGVTAEFELASKFAGTFVGMSVEAEDGAVPGRAKTH